MRLKERTLDNIANERQALLAELTGLECTLKAISDDIGKLRTLLTHNYIQETKLRQAAGSTN